MSKFNAITKRLLVALPSGDELASNLLPRVVPRVGSTLGKSYFQRELEAAHKVGAWLPKISLLPNVGKFEIKLNSYDPALLANGILSRTKSETVLYVNRNSRMNRYLVYSYWRLYKHLGNPKYWSIAMNLIRNSSCLLGVAIHSVDKNMYRELTSHDLYRLLKRINLMRANFHFKDTLWMEGQVPLKAMRHYVKYYRVYIPKTIETVRPLGVPTRAWRIYQKMWLIPIMGFTGGLMPTNFHGYIPQRGTGTAWKEILTNVIHKANIFEVDFKGFFPSVPTAELTYALYLEGSIPLSVCAYLHYMNNSLPMFLTEDKLPETHYGEGSEASLILDQLKLKLTRPVATERLLPGISTVGLRDPNAKLVESSLSMAAQRPYGYKAPQGVVQGIKPAELPDTPKTGQLLRKELEPKLMLDDRALEYTTPKYDLNFEMLKWRGSKGIPLNAPLTEVQRKEMWAAIGDKPLTASSQTIQILLGTKTQFGVGLPQGATLSPYLSILYLEIVLRRLGKPANVEYLFYADDGIFYSDDYNALMKWIQQLDGHRALPTSLAHYNIVIAKEKSAMVKSHGQWLKPLKFLGLKFIPGDTLGTSVLQAATRAKIEKPGSTLVFDRAQLVFYDYSIRLITVGLKYLEYRASTAKSFAMRAYYTSLAVLFRSFSDGTVKSFKAARHYIGYLYLIARALSAGVPNTYLLFNSSAHLLKDVKSLKWILPFLVSSSEGEALREIKATELINEDDKEKIFRAIKWLKGGYENSWYHEGASGALLHKLENGYNSVGGLGIPVIYPRDGVEENLRKFMAAPMFFGYSLEDLQASPFWISRQLGVRNEIVPLDLFRFLVSIIMPVFGVFVPPMLNQPVTKRDVSTKSPHFTLRLNWLKIQKYIADHQFANLARSRYFGLIMSRLYSGAWIPDDFKQSFKFDFKRGSLAEFLKDHDTDNVLNVFVGSSYASHEIVRLLSYLKRSPRTKAAFTLFKDGYMSHNSWEESALIELEAPSLAQEFPGAKEPDWSKANSA